ncbi:MAG: ABC transporter permease [Bacteroidota bacterium]
MFQNFIKIALRNLFKYKTFSLVNLLGLLVGLTCFLLIGLWIRDERSYDQFHDYSGRLYRVMENIRFSDGQMMTQFSAPGPLGEAMKAEVPEVVYATTMDTWTNTVISYENQSVKEVGRYVGEDFLKMFSFPLLQGDKERALSEPNSIVVSKKLADKLFPGVNPLGKTLKVADWKEHMITGVIEDLPGNTVFEFEFLLPLNDFLERNAWARDWNANGLVTWVMLDEGADITAVNYKIKDFLKERSEQDQTELFLQPLTDVYLRTDFENGTYAGGGRIEQVQLFGLIALLLLLIACINFMNLSTARAAIRAKEVGVKKVIGAGRRWLTIQFLGEAVLMCVLAALVALIALDLLLPWFNQFTGKEMTFPFGEINTWLLFGSIVLTTGILAGSYPAFVLSSFRPIAVLKRKTSNVAKGALLRKGLVVAQFTIAVFLIGSMLVIQQQMDFLKNENLGYDKELLLYVTMNPQIQTKYNDFKSKLASLPGVRSVAASHSQLTGFYNSTSELQWEGKAPQDNRQFVYETVTPDFLTTIGASLVEGRDFSDQHPSDTSNYIINESAAQAMGLQPPFIGQPLKMWNNQGQIVGVVEDFHFRSLKTTIEPLVMTMSSPFVWTAYVRVDGQQIPETLRQMENICKDYSPVYPFEYMFADEAYQRLYENEQVVSRLSSIFAFLAILVSCLGLFGLATFMAERRHKEICIRKVLGATAGSVVGLLSKDFLKLVAIALVVASPLAYYFMEQWLQDFAYRIDMPWWVFALAGGLAIGIAFLTVGLQSVKAALANPAESLRSE